jgi:hypothetical protein
VKNEQIYMGKEGRGSDPSYTVAAGKLSLLVNRLCPKPDLQLASALGAGSASSKYGLKPLTLEGSPERKLFFKSLGKHLPY